jgi:hypothetical protein
MIEDFLSFVDDSFPFLNPFDSLHQCKRNPELLDRRIYNLLKSLLQDERDESKIGYHRDRHGRSRSARGPELDAVLSCCIGTRTASHQADA